MILKNPLKPIPMKMELWEYRVAGVYVTERDIAAINRPDLYEATPGGVDGRVGMLGEMAFAKWLGVYFDPTIGITTAPDVAPGCQVRATHHYREGQLILRSRDNPEHKFILARVQLKPTIEVKDITVSLVGWCTGAWGLQHPVKTPEGARNAPGSIFVDTNCLHDMETLDVASIRSFYERLRNCAPRKDARSLELAGTGTRRNAGGPQEVRASSPRLF